MRSLPRVVPGVVGPSRGAVLRAPTVWWPGLGAARGSGLAWLVRRAALLRTPSHRSGRYAIRRPAAVALAAALVLGAGGTGAWAWQDGRRPAAADDLTSARAAAAVSDDASQVSGLTAQAAQAAAQGLTDQSRAELQQAVAAARAVLDGSAGQVSDDAVRTALASALTEADQALAGTVAPARAATLTASVSTAAAQVNQAQQAWQAARAAQAAAQAAAKARAAASPAPTSSVDPCRTTYTGPPFWTSVPTATGDGSNGNLPASSMTALSWTTDSHGTRFYLLTPAAQALERLNVAFRAAFGHNLDIDLAYRDYATQVAMRAALGTVAAVPGTSPHGYGKAIDVPELPCEYGWNSAQRAWLLAHGPSFGWVQPAWALQNGSGPEYWHYEYTG